jgi:ribokinase
MTTIEVLGSTPTDVAAHVARAPGRGKTVTAVALGEGRSVPEASARASSAAALCVPEPAASTSVPYRSELDAA